MNTRGRRASLVPLVALVLIPNQCRVGEGEGADDRECQERIEVVGGQHESKLRA